MLRAIGTLFVCTLYGALGTAMVRFLYASYEQIGLGLRRDEIGLQTLLHQPFELQDYTTKGAAAGLAFGTLVVLVRGGVWLSRRIREPKVGDAPESDPDAILRAEREERADRFLASRRA